MFTKEVYIHERAIHSWKSCIFMKELYIHDRAIYSATTALQFCKKAHIIWSKCLVFQRVLHENFSVFSWKSCIFSHNSPTVYHKSPYHQIILWFKELYHVRILLSIKEFYHVRVLLSIKELYHQSILCSIIKEFYHQSKRFINQRVLSIKVFYHQSILSLRSSILKEFYHQSILYSIIKLSCVPKSCIIKKPPKNGLIVLWSATNGRVSTF